VPAFSPTPDPPVTSPRFRLLLLFAAALLAFGVAGCGRRGPLELPPETQARGEALKAEAAAARTRNAGAAPRPAPGAAEPAAPPPPIPGTIGNRPPDQYPFILDPLL
jgi:predicted small lipoprotein YifL